MLEFYLTRTSLLIDVERRAVRKNKSTPGAHAAVHLNVLWMVTHDPWHVLAGNPETSLRAIMGQQWGYNGAILGLCWAFLGVYIRVMGFYSIRDITPIMENQMENQMESKKENEMETGAI